ncbi:MAG: type I methionyl aminopeptidase [Candidatus Niyogibacteria bacterium]|nr:type I methionyl aminopeptidase [Candidatus Niyogibacteria bacterium]
MIIKNSEELKILREGGKRLGAILRQVAKRALPGVRTIELDRYAEELIAKAAGVPAFKGYKTYDASSEYPATLCVSVNDEVVHGIPSERELKDGDIVGLDIGMRFGGLYTDTAITVPVGNVDEKYLKLIETTRAALAKGIAEVKAGARLGDIGAAIQKHAEAGGFSVVKELVGHGVGRKVHEEPEIPNWGKKGTGAILKEGMVLALEPMLNEKKDRVKLASDGWTYVTSDGSRSAHFEHTIVVTKKGAEVLTQTINN